MVNDIISDTTPAIKGDKKIHSNTATVTGLAKGWHELPNGIMAPCFSFQVDYLMENGEHRTEFIDMPTFPKYWPQGY
jgi:hypothetical protein